MLTMIATARLEPACDKPDTATAAIILGIDPGLQRTGYALLGARRAREAHLCEAGVVRLDPRRSLPQRLAELERCVAELIATHRPAALACEELYAHYRHPRTAILMGHARGVILALAARAGLDVLNLSATRVKKTLTGSGHASKSQMQRAVAAALGLPRLPGPHDVADAIAIALCGLRALAAPRRSAPA
jgi:crossover junction endodeoxyribonuclease RuvC